MILAMKIVNSRAPERGINSREKIKHDSRIITELPVIYFHVTNKMTSSKIPRKIKFRMPRSWISS